MKIFLDTAVLDEIRAAASWGILDGVTTNPTLAAKAGRAFQESILAISEIIGERATVSAETVSLEADAMVREAKLVTSWAPNVIAKIPCTPEGIKAVWQCTQAGIPTNVTLVFNATQGLLTGLLGVDCADIDSYAYALVDVDAVAMAIAAKDAEGNVLCDKRLEAER